MHDVGEKNLEKHDKRRRKHKIGEQRLTGFLGVSTMSIANMPTAMQMLNETYIAPSTCAMKTAVTRHHRCGGMSPKKDISPLPAMMALSANSTLLAMIRYNTHSGKSTPSRGMPSSWLRMTRLKAMRKTAVRISMVRSFICILPDGLRRIPTFSY